MGQSIHKVKIAPQNFFVPFLTSPTLSNQCFQHHLHLAHYRHTQWIRRNFRMVTKKKKKVETRRNGIPESKERKSFKTNRLNWRSKFKRIKTKCNHDLHMPEEQLEGQNGRSHG